jgi:hypothetical protein
VKNTFERRLVRFIVRQATRVHLSADKASLRPR